MANHFDLHAALTLATQPGPFVTMTLPVTGVPATDRTQFKSLLKQGKERLLAVAPDRTVGLRGYLIPLTRSVDNGVSGLLIGRATDSYHYWLHSPVSATVTVTYQPNVLPILQARTRRVTTTAPPGTKSFERRCGWTTGWSISRDAPATMDQALGPNNVGGTLATVSR